MAGNTVKALLERLADGQVHSGVELGQALQCSRAAVWKQVRALRAMGLDMESVPGKGYRLPAPLELLDPSVIERHLPADAAARLRGLTVEFTAESTNARLLDEPPPVPGSYRVLMAEYQTGGRGRRGRRWLSPLGSGLCFSASWLWETPPRDLAALGLVVGIAVVQAAASLGARDVALKWPNDVVGGAGKLSGILVDVVGEAQGPLKVVAGVGINVSLPRDFAAGVEVEQGSLPPISLDRLAGGAPVSRNLLAARLIDALQAAVEVFATEGFAPFADRWRDLDWLRGQPVTITAGGRQLVGTARGIRQDGALLVEQRDTVTAVLAGDVSLRAPA